MCRTVVPTLAQHWACCPTSGVLPQLAVCVSPTLTPSPLKPITYPYARKTSNCVDNAPRSTWVAIPRTTNISRRNLQPLRIIRNVGTPSNSLSLNCCMVWWSRVVSVTPTVTRTISGLFLSANSSRRIAVGSASLSKCDGRTRNCAALTYTVGRFKGENTAVGRQKQLAVAGARSLLVPGSSCEQHVAAHDASAN